MLPSTVAYISADQPASDESTVVTECSPARKVSRCVIPSPIKTGLMTQKSQSVLPLPGPHFGAFISGLVQCDWRWSDLPHKFHLGQCRTIYEQG